MAKLFESETCSRCGGSGQYSYCQSYGTTCFKCHGTKTTLTKRGAIAQRLFESFCSKRTDQLQPGDKFRDITITAGGSAAYDWFTVQAVRPDTSHQSSLVNGVMVEHIGLLAIETDKCLFAGWSPSTRVRVSLTHETKRKVADIVLAYQSLLSKTGKEPAWLKTIAY